MNRLSLLFIVLMQIAAFGAKQELSDEQIQKKLIGTWLPDEETARKIAGEVIYKKDFTFSAVGLIKVPDRTIRWEAAGKWRVEGGKLILEYTKSTLPDFVPVGKVTTDRIISISDNELVFVPEKGERQVRIRKRNDSP